MILIKKSVYRHFVLSERPVNSAEECKAILKYKTKNSCMSKNSSKASNKNKQGCFFDPDFPKNEF